MPDARVVALLTTLDDNVRKVHTQSLDVSFNEILDMFKAGELDISPAYQRLFQWPVGARSRFIESLMLEMPVPPIYVVEEDEGKYLLIDGLQRISSYLHLRGELEAPHLREPVVKGQKLTLEDCDIVTELNGLTWDDLGTALQIRLKRAFVRMEVIRQGSDARFKYHMFKRLNSGGEALTAQQLRNCTIRLLDAKFNDFVIYLSEDVNYQTTTQNLTEEQELGAFNQELVLRFFAMKNDRPEFKHDIADFLTEYMEKVSDPASSTAFDYSTEENVFRKTFDVLATALGEDAFAPSGKDAKKLNKSFSVLHFEAVSLGIQDALTRLSATDGVQMNLLGQTLINLKLDSGFASMTKGGGKNSSGQLNTRIMAVQTALQNAGL